MFFPPRNDKQIVETSDDVNLGAAQGWLRQLKSHLSVVHGIYASIVLCHFHWRIYLGGRSRPLPLFWVKKEEIAEGRKDDRASKTKPGPPLAQGLDPPLTSTSFFANAAIDVQPTY